VTIKTVSLSEDVYRKLRAEKRNGESFSEVVARLLAGKQPSIMKYAGAWQPMTAREVRKIRARIERIRHELP